MYNFRVYEPATPITLVSFDDAVTGHFYWYNLDGHPTKKDLCHLRYRTETQMIDVSTGMAVMKESSGTKMYVPLLPGESFTITNLE